MADITTWGWVHLILGVLVCLAGFGVIVGATWARVVGIALVSLSAIFFTVYPIIDVPSPLSFAVKIVAVTAIANAIGVAIYLSGKKRQRA